MTWSIRTGAIATQALVNPFYGTEGLRFLEQGLSARDVVSALTAADIGRDHNRQALRGGRV